MVRIPEPRVSRSEIVKLQFVVDAGLTTVFAIAVATGISEDEAGRVLAGEIEPTDEQRERLKALLRDYSRAIVTVNAETLKRRL
jgi:hypothetical protein